MEYVYILYVGHGMYKIGRTKAINRRVLELGERRVVEIVRVKDSRKVETFLHRKFANKRLIRDQEIFKLNDEDILFIHNYALDIDVPDENLLF